MRLSVVVLAICLAAMSSWSVASDQPLPGDVDLSGQLDASDVQLVVNAALGTQTNVYADIDYSGAVGASDLQVVINAVLGLVIDSDGDGLSDVAESNLGTDPSKIDTDDDGAYDCYEVSNAKDPLRDDGPHYELVFKEDVAVDYEFIFTYENYQIMRGEEKGGFGGDQPYVPGTVIIEDRVFENAGIRYKGYSSLFASGNGPKKPFKIDFDRYVDGQNFAGVKKLNFSNGVFDPSLLREKLAYEIFAAAGAPTSRTSHINLYLTVPGLYERELIGIYTMVQQVDKRYLSEWFSDNDGNLYKSGDSGADLSWKGEDQEEYRRYYDKKTNETEDDWLDFIQFLNVLNNEPDGTFKSEIEQVFNVDSFLKYMAANTVLSNMDSIAGRQANYYLYNNPDTGLFEFLPWDLNMAFGLFGNWDYNLLMDIHQPTSPAGADRVLVDRILAVPEYVEVYEARVRALIEGPFLPMEINARIDELYDLIREHVYATEHNLDSNEDFEQSLVDSPSEVIDDNLRAFVAIRADSISQQLR